MAHPKQETSSKDSTSSSSNYNAKNTSSSSSGSFLKPLVISILLVPALSYLIMDGESFTFGYRPEWSRLNYWRPAPSNVRMFTDSQLAQYDGSNPDLPIYLAINGSVFDVSANPATYGPGGGYSIFSGVDAARGFVTGCFAEDRNWDLRGVEDMFLELDDELDLFEAGKWGELVEKFGDSWEEGKEWGLSEDRKKILRKRCDERRKIAWENVESTIDHWNKFFRNHEKYKYVGEVKHKDISGEPVKKVCDAALKKRPMKQKAE